MLLVVLFCYFLPWKPGNSEEALCICSEINEIPGVKNMQIIKIKYIQYIRNHSYFNKRQRVFTLFFFNNMEQDRSATNILISIVKFLVV